MIILLIKAPTGLDLALPIDKDGNSTATAGQLAMHADMQSIAAEWGQAVGTSGTDTLYRVVVRHTDLAAVESLITKYQLPLTILHAQDAYQSDSGTIQIIDGVVTPVLQTVVHKQASKASILLFMADIVTYNGIETSRTLATTVSIPNCSDMAGWEI